jgi:ribonuclease R
MKNSKKSNTGSPLRTPNPKGQKLPYAKLRMLAIETIQQSKSPSWTPRQLIKKLKVANGKADMVRVLDALVKQGKLASAGEDIYTSLMRPKVGKSAPEASSPAVITGKNVHQGRVDMTRSGSAYIIMDELEDDQDLC